MNGNSSVGGTFTEREFPTAQCKTPELPYMFYWVSVQARPCAVHSLSSVLKVDSLWWEAVDLAVRDPLPDPIYNQWEIGRKEMGGESMVTRFSRQIMNHRLRY